MISKTINVEEIINECDRLWDAATDARNYGDEEYAAACENTISRLTQRLKAHHDAVSIFRMMQH